MKLPALLNGRRRGLYLQLAANGLLQAGLAIGIAMMMAVLVDSALVEQSLTWSDTGPLILMLMAMATCLALLRRHERVAAELLGQRYVRELRRRLFNRVLSARHESREANRQGLLLVRFVADMAAMRNWISLGLARLTVGVIVITAVIATLAWWHWGLALVVAVGVMISAGVMFWQGSRLRPAIAEARRHQGRVAANMTEKTRSAATVRMFDQQQAEQQYLMRQSGRLLRASRIKAARIGELRGLVEFIATGMMAGTFVFCAYAVQNGQLTAGTFVAAMSLVGFIAGPLRNMGRAQEYALSNRVAADNLRRLAERLKPMRDRQADPDLHIQEGAIEFAGLAMGDRLQPIEAHIPAGKKIALVGANGAGKSTLLRILASLEPVLEGEIRIDEEKLNRYTFAEQRKAISLVSSDVPLLRGSLRHNLTYGMPVPDEARLAEVCARCGVDQIARRMPQGLETRIHENGANLSQGERARVALARALLRKPKILLLDEAEANLDMPTVHAIAALLEHFPGTVVMATHRREAAASADEVWHLHQGHLIAQGAPTALLEGVGATAHLFRKNLRLVG